MHYLFDPGPHPFLKIVDSEARFPVRRIFCVGRNYADHAREMGALDQAEGREPPFFFMKPADALTSGREEIRVPYPPLTADLQHEVELVVALSGGGANLMTHEALGSVYGYTVGLDLTRRDMQARAKEKGHPWDMSKGFDHSAVAGLLQPASVCGHLNSSRIWLKVNGETRQDGDLAQMTWKVAEVIANLSTSVCLAPGDLIYTGTPAGVGTIVPGDVLEGGIEGVGKLRVRIEKTKSLTGIEPLACGELGTCLS
ncbi:MAG: fumarylacetoacetate hydrolase family protein [Betaproteobacteria bacterium]